MAWIDEVAREPDESAISVEQRFDIWRDMDSLDIGNNQSV